MSARQSAHELWSSMVEYAAYELWSSMEEYGRAMAKMVEQWSSKVW